jgi:CheY-like chemotaxis protein
VVEDHRPEWSVLLIDNDEEDFTLARLMLSRIEGRKVILDWAPTCQAGEQLLQARRYDAALVDYDLGPANGIDLIRKQALNGQAPPLILYTGRGSFEVDLEAMQAGATFYITKGKPTRSCSNGPSVTPSNASRMKLRSARRTPGFPVSTRSCARAARKCSGF